MTHTALLAAIKASLAMSESRTERHAAYPVVKPKEKS